MNFWEKIGVIKPKRKPPIDPTKESARVLEEFQVKYTLSLKGKPKLGNISGIALVLSDSKENAEKFLSKTILEQIEVSFNRLTY